MQAKERGELPIADYDRSLPSDPRELAKRKIRGKKHDKSEWPINSEDVADSTVRVDYLDPTLPDFPVPQSDAVVVGEILEANAYLSDDKSGVYSEFGVSVEQVLKNDSLAALSASCLIDIEREGGRVRFQSGKVHSYSIDKANMPRVGAQYILFLKRQGTEQAYHLLTAYELRGDQIFPLDELPQFKVHKGDDKQSFLTRLSLVLAAKP